MWRAAGLVGALLFSLPAPSVAQSLEQYAKSIEDNYRRLGIYHAKVVMQIYDGEAKLPTAVLRSEIAGSIDRFRCTLGEGADAHYWYRDRLTWYRSTPTVDSYVIGPLESMPGRGAVEPQQFGTNDVKRPLLATLRACQNYSLEHAANDDVIVRIPRSIAGMQEIWSLHLSKDHCYLPTRSEFSFDGRKNQEIHNSYVAVAHDAYFPQTVETRFFADDPVAPTQRLVETVQLLSLDEPAVAQSLVPPALPQQSIVSELPVPVTKDNRWYPVLAIVGALGIVAAAMFAGWNALASRKNR